MNKHPSAENTRDAAPEPQAAERRSAKGAKKSTAKRTCIMVLGMHRSGTSALTRVLNLFGAALPKNVLGAGIGNGDGHWEPKTIVELHDVMLRELGSSWDDWRRLAPSRIVPWHPRIAQAFHNEYGKHPLAVFKDPRVCRFAEVYLDIFAELSVEPIPVLTFRNPLAVCDSLAKRNGFSREYAALIWLRHALDAEKSTRGLNRAVVSYEQLVDDWRQEISMFAAQTKITLPAITPGNESTVEKHISPLLRHHSHTRAAIAYDGVIGKWLGRVFDAFGELHCNPNDAAAQFSLDHIRREFDPLTEAFGAATYGEVTRFELELDRLRAVERQFLAARSSSAVGQA
jgi:O-antigen biosynthesis protein